MKKSMVLALMICLVLSAGSCYAEEVKANFDDRSSKPVTFTQQNGDEALNLDELKKGCLAATITAIHLEMDRYQRWIDVRKQQGDLQGLAMLQESLGALKADLDKYAAMDAKDYVLPEPVETIAWVEGNPGKDTIVYIEGMSKSGPWYHLAGIKGGDYATLRPGVKYRLNLYAVYARSYGWMKSAYIFVGGSQQQSQGKRVIGEVFARKNHILLDDVVKCENYQVYLLKDTKPGSKGERKLDSKSSSFDITLSADELENYSYLEFVSAYGSKVITLNEISDNAIKIILERDMVLKKPAIYLYPEQKLKVEITHHFKGKILNTYPSYTDNWTVFADSDGNLLNVKDNRNYKYLFWDGVYSFPKAHYQIQSGFYVKNEDYVSFLQTKLANIGLNEVEINDFIVYWLPAMSRYKNCFVHFRINDNIDGSSVLETKPKADTVIRVFMEFSGFDTINRASILPEQDLPTFTRKGFTLVEWGGAEIGNSKFE